MVSLEHYCTTVALCAVLYSLNHSLYKRWPHFIHSFIHHFIVAVIQFFICLFFFQLQFNFGDCFDSLIGVID